MPYANGALPPSVIATIAIAGLNSRARSLASYYRRGQGVASGAI